MQCRTVFLECVKQLGGRSQPLSFQLQTGLRFNKNFQAILLLAELPLVREVLRFQGRPRQRDRHHQRQCRPESKEHGKTLSRYVELDSDSTLPEDSPSSVESGHCHHLNSAGVARKA